MSSELFYFGLRTRRSKNFELDAKDIGERFLQSRSPKQNKRIEDHLVIQGLKALKTFLNMEPTFPATPSIPSWPPESTPSKAKPATVAKAGSS